MTYSDPNDLDLESALSNLGMADYLYVKATQQAEELEQYRNLLLKRIDQLYGNRTESEGVGTPAGLREGDGVDRPA